MASERETKVRNLDEARDGQSRPAEEEDRPFLEDVFVRAGREMITAARGEWEEARERGQFQKQLDLSSTHVIRQDGCDVGFLMLVTGEGVSELHTLCVLPAWQGQGLGTKVTCDVVDEARRAGRAVELSVLKANPRARVLYERLGFHVVSDTEHHHRMHFAVVPNPRMRRINVTGNAGSGKSTVAAQLGALLKLEVFGLDSVVWRPGWRKTAPAARAQAELAIAERPTWVVDGVSERIRAAADTIVFLDYPRRTVLGRCARRNVRYLFRSRPGLPPDCPEILILPRLLKTIWRFPQVVRPAILSDFARWRGRKNVFHIRSDAELQDFLATLGR